MSLRSVSLPQQACSGATLRGVQRRSRGPVPVRANFDFQEVLQKFIPQPGSSKKDAQNKAKRALLELVEGQQRGVKTTKAQRAEVEAAIDALTPFSPEVTTTDRFLTGTWSLLWTSERETLFLIEKGLAFVGPTGDVLQVIDVEEGTLNNVVEFADGTAAFIVDSTAEVADEKRVNFKFTSAGLKTPTRSFQLPPFGQGWFENIYIDGDLRIARDSRGDTLIVERAKTKWDRSAYDA